MEIRQVNENGKGSFKALKDGKQAGLLGYILETENRLIINHTEVSPEFEGKGLAMKLLMEAVEFARQKNLKIVPACSYARVVFDRTKDIRDVLYTS